MKRTAIYSDANIKDLKNLGADWAFADEQTKENLHAIHPYPAKFIPQIPRKALGLWAPKGGVILDPFAGVGTTLLESQLSGRKSIGIDTNPVAALVSQTKTYPYTDQDLQYLQNLVISLETTLADAKLRQDLVPNDDRFLSWFDPQVIDAVYKIKGLALQETDPYKSFMLTALSAIIVRVSKQDSDTRYSRVEKPQLTSADVEKIYLRRLRQSVEALSSIHPKPKAVATFIHGDARVKSSIKKGSVDLIITSPPYLNAYDYHKYHRQRIHVIDGDPVYARTTEIGGHDRFTRPKADPEIFFGDLESCLVEWDRVLKPEGKAFILIGDAIVHGKSVMVADEMIRIAEVVGFELEWRAIRPVATSRKSFNSGARMDQEHMLLIRKN
jgi:site-specific DNA-methyltransferase (cytosine-N4-specific)